MSSVHSRWCKRAAVTEKLPVPDFGTGIFSWGYLEGYASHHGELPHTRGV